MKTHLVHVKIISLIIFINLICSGCGSSFKGIKLPDTRLSESRGRQILAHLQNESAKLKSFRGMALAEHNIGKDHYRVRYLFAVKSPENIHFQALPTTSGMAMSILKSDGKKAAFLDTAPQIAYMDVADEGIVKRALSVPLPPEDLLYLLAGKVPQRIFTPGSPVRVLEAGEKVFLVVGQEKETYEINSKTNLLSRAVYKDNIRGKVTLDISWNSPNKDTVPTVIELTIPSDSYSGTLTWRTTEINPTLKSSLFDPTPPQGWEVKDFK